MEKTGGYVCEEDYAENNELAVVVITGEHCRRGDVLAAVWEAMTRKPQRAPLCDAMAISRYPAVFPARVWKRYPAGQPEGSPVEGKLCVLSRHPNHLPHLLALTTEYDGGL